MINMRISTCVHCKRRIQFHEHHSGNTWVHTITGLCVCGDTFAKIAEPIGVVGDTTIRWGFNQPGTVSMRYAMKASDTWLLAGREAMRLMTPMAVYSGTGTCDTWTLQAIVNPDGSRTDYLE